jgi:hypothetical protein
MRSSVTGWSSEVSAVAIVDDEATTSRDLRSRSSMRSPTW